MSIEHFLFHFFFFITTTYAALRLKWRGKCFNSLCLMCGCRPLAAGFHKCIAYVGAALRLSGDETVKIDIGWQRGCGWSQIFLVCRGGRVLPQFAQSAPLLCPREREREKGNLCPTQRMSFEMHMLLFFFFNTLQALCFLNISTDLACILVIYYHNHYF